ncbi:MAG: hypothetical protein WC149_00985 [Arcobacteraceae bacterium]
MGVKLFVVTLFVVSIFSLFSEITKYVIKKDTKDSPLITFTDAIMYTLNQDEVLRIVDAQTAIRYKTRDEMYKAMITTRVKDKNNNDVKDTVSAQKMIKKADLYSFFDDVKYNRDDFMVLRTHELYYDIKKEIAYNSVPFQSIYNGDVLNGNNFYADNKTKFFRASKSHFEINMNKPIKKN